MFFFNIEFFVFISITFLLYYLKVFRKYQVAILILASFVFYAYNQPWLLAVLLLSILFNAVTSYLVYTDKQNRQLFWGVSGVVLNLALLVLFKYSALIASIFVANVKAIEGPGAFIVTLPLPLGISFFTVQGISLVVDVYRARKNNRELNFPVVDFKTHLFNTAFFNAFFPKQAAGPILKAHEFMPQIGEKYLKDIDWIEIFKCLIAGYFFKMVIADNLKDYTQAMNVQSALLMSSWNLFIVTVGYAMQIFADFAGYSLIAIGLGRLFGYTIPDNFRFPFISKSLSELWTRWHISFSTWIREYLYIPLGGNKKGNIRTYLNLIVSMLLAGLWHGSAWGFLGWGLWHGIWLSIERPFLNRKKKSEKSAGNPFFSALRILFVFFIFTMGLPFFKIQTLTESLVYYFMMFKNIGRSSQGGLTVPIVVYSLPVVIYHLNYLYQQKRGERARRFFEPFVYAILLFCIIFNSGGQSVFIYFNF